MEDPVYTATDSCRHDIEFGQFAVIFTLTIFSMIIAIKFGNIVNLRATLVLKLFNLIS